MALAVLLPYKDKAIAIIDGNHEFNRASKAIVKPHGSSGTADPLDQRATVGAKVTAFAACVLNSDWLVSIHHGVTA